MQTTIRSALYANRPAAAIETYRNFVPDNSLPAVIVVLTVTDAADAHHLLGQYDEQVRLLEGIRADLPTSEITDWALRRQASAVATKGEIEEIERVVEEAVGEDFLFSEFPGWRVDACHELRAHGHADASLTMINRVLAGFPDDCGDPTVSCTRKKLEALLIAGRNEDAAKLAIGLDPESAGWPSALVFAGIATARTGDIAGARALSERLDELSETDPFYERTRIGDLIIGKAMIAAALGELDESLDLLRRGLSRGATPVLTDLGIYELRHNIFFEPLWDHPEFQEILRPKG
jgi:hypothetical protein